MTRYCCPNCEDHPTLMENLDCYFCGGRYVWKDNIEVSVNKGKDAIKRLRSRNR